MEKVTLAERPKKVEPIYFDRSSIKELCRIGDQAQENKDTQAVIEIIDLIYQIFDR